MEDYSGTSPYKWFSYLDKHPKLSKVLGIVSTSPMIFIGSHMAYMSTTTEDPMFKATALASSAAINYCNLEIIVSTVKESRQWPILRYIHSRLRG